MQVIHGNIFPCNPEEVMEWFKKRFASSKVKTINMAAKKLAIHMANTLYTETKFTNYKEEINPFPKNNEEFVKTREIFKITFSEQLNFHRKY